MSDTVESITNLIEIKQRRLNILEEQEAKFGSLYVPPHIVAEIQELRKELPTLWAKLATLQGGSPVPESTPAPPRPASGPVRILFLAASPHDKARLRVGEEMRTIDERLRQSEFRDKFELESGFAVRYTDISDKLLRYKPHIVHFAGHGDSTTEELVFEDAGGKSHPVSREALAELFEIVKHNIRCVVLNACLSEKQAEGIAREIDCVVGTSASITDKAALSFAAGFYRGLGYGESVELAFKLGRNEAGLGGADGSMLRLLSREGVKAGEVTFV